MNRLPHIPHARTMCAPLFAFLLLVMPAALAQDDITMYGSVSLTSAGMMGMDQTVASATFRELPEPVAAPAPGDYFGADRIDTCIVSEQGQMQQPEPPEAAIPFEEATPVGAGEPIEIVAGGSSYVTLSRSGDQYMGRTGQALPQSATVEIPGAEGGFPAFSGNAFPEAQPIEFSSPSDLQSIDASTTFAWERTTELGVVLIVMQGTGSGGQEESIVCFAADDGEFSLSDQGVLSDVTPQAVLMYGRNAVETYQSGDALLSLSVFSTTLAMQIPGMPTQPQ